MIWKKARLIEILPTPLRCGDYSRRTSGGMLKRQVSFYSISYLTRYVNRRQLDEIEHNGITGL